MANQKKDRDGWIANPNTKVQIRIRKEMIPEVKRLFEIIESSDFVGLVLDNRYFERVHRG